MSAEFIQDTQKTIIVLAEKAANAAMELRERLGRIATSGLIVASSATAIFGVGEAISENPAYAVTTVYGDLGYPWPDAACEFGAAGGASCVNPQDANDKYDWGITDANGFHQYRGGSYEYRNCTDYVAWKLEGLDVAATKVNGLRNGGEWYSNAPANERTLTPKAGEAAIVPATYDSHGNETNVGHVAFVESVNSIDPANPTNDDITVSEYNHDAKGDGDTRTGKAGDMGFTEYVDFGAIVSGDPGSGNTLSRPSAIVFNGALNVFKLGGDGHIYAQYWNGTSWTGFASIGEGMASDPAVLVNGNALNVFARGANGQVYTAYNTGAGWTGWSSLGATTMKNNPRVVQYGSEVDVFSLGTDNQPYKDTWQAAAGWGGWASLGNYMDSSPAPVVYGSELDVVMRGGDNAIYKDTWNGSGWGGFGSLGCCLSGNPDVLQYGAELDIWSNAPGNHIWKRTWSGSAWGNWEDFGGTLNGDPDAMQYGDDMEVFARGSDGHMYTRFWSASGSYWSGWTSLGGTIAGDPTAIQFGSELDVFATGSDGKTYKDTFQPATGWGGFTALPG